MNRRPAPNPVGVGSARECRTAVLLSQRGEHATALAGRARSHRFGGAHLWEQGLPAKGPTRLANQLQKTQSLGFLTSL